MEADTEERAHNMVVNFNFQINNPVFAIQQLDRPDVVPSWQTVFALAATGLLSFLQVKFQGNQRSPFETYPKTTFLALLSFLLYCFSHGAKLMHSSVMFGALFLSSVSSLLFPDYLKPVLISASLAFSVSQLLADSGIRSFWADSGIRSFWADSGIRSFWAWLLRTISGSVGAERSRVRNRGGGNVARNGRVMLPV